MTNDERQQAMTATVEELESERHDAEMARRIFERLHGEDSLLTVMWETRQLAIEKRLAHGMEIANAI